MKYFIKRDMNEFGPYTLADLQRYVGTGNILITDLARSEAMTEWMPVSSIIGTIPVPAAAPTPQSYQPAASEYPLPPGLHWGLVLLLGAVTCGIFSYVWFFIQAAYVKKLVPQNRASLWLGIGLGTIVCAVILPAAAGHSSAAALGLLLQLVGSGFCIAASFSMKNGIEEHFNGAENIGLTLSGVMTFFFNVLYFQYHFTKIRNARQQQGAFAAGA